MFKKMSYYQDILEEEGDIILKKDRTKGPGAAVVRVVYRKECSKFYQCVKSAPDAPPMSQASIDNEAGF